LRLLRRAASSGALPSQPPRRHCPETAYEDLGRARARPPALLLARALLLGLMRCLSLTCGSLLVLSILMLMP
jgi:hypothetical protein